MFTRPEYGSSAPYIVGPWLVDKERGALDRLAGSGLVWDRRIAVMATFAFIKADGRIFSILRMEPSATALYGPMGDFRFALEARKGFFESQGLRQGEARLVTPPALAR